MPMPLSLRVPADGKQSADANASTTSPINPSIKDLLYYRELVFPLSDDDLQTLRQMRLASGTYYDRIPIWLSELESGNRLMWFVYLRNPHSHSSALGQYSQQAQAQARPAPAIFKHAPISQPVSPTTPISPASLSFILNTPPPTPDETKGNQPAQPAQPAKHPQSSLPSKQSQSHSRSNSHSQYNQAMQPASPPLGMVCLLKVNPNDMSLASAESRRCELTSLWIYPMYRAFGIGAAIIAEMEKQAALRGAVYVTFNTTAGCITNVNVNANVNASAAENGTGVNNPQDYSQTLKTLNTFRKLGYVEYKPREHRYSVNDVLAAGLPVESTLAAFFEKRVDDLAV